MWEIPVLPTVALLLSAVSADTSIGPDVNGKYWIYGTGIKASFIPYGASVSNLIVNDQYGVPRDVVGGFDNASYYGIDRQHPHFGGVPGRYANRIKNSSFELDGVTYHILPNEHPTAANPHGVDTLHGGPDGWDWRNFTVASYSANSITFSIVDPDGMQGFPGEVISYITYTLGNMTWDFKMVAIATTKKTPIMLSSHTYWNLDGFANNETQSVLNHTFYLPYSGQRVDTDNILIPTGNILASQPGSVNDFWSAPKQIGHSFSDPEILGNCGFNCSGYGEHSKINFMIKPADATWQTPATWSTVNKMAATTGVRTATSSRVSSLHGLAFSSRCTATRRPSRCTHVAGKTDPWP